LKGLRERGIDHRGIVSDKEKIELYGRAKVFLFPSLFEGFGIAVGEALSAKMIVISWKIPALEERFFCQSNTNMRLVNVDDNELFVKNALEAINDYNRSGRSQLSIENLGITQTWDEVGKNVVKALEIAIN
jgi:glycosyltransferase involved in cell wall biosynthesis